jgi:hypothetical protein
MEKSPSSRFGTFFSRVEIEREVLGIINARFGHRAALNGVTQPAIDKWGSCIAGSDMTADQAICKVLGLLHRISVRSDAEADQSRLVFADEPTHALPISELIVALREACACQPGPRADQA